MENQFLKVKLVEVTKCNIHIYKQIKLECLRLSVAFKIIVYRNGRFFQRLPTKTFFYSKITQKPQWEILLV